MFTRIAAAAASLALVSAAAQAQETLDAEAEPVPAAAESVESVMALSTESAADILGKPKLLPATAKLPDGECNDGLYQEAAFFLVLPSDAPEVGDVLTLADFTDPRSGDSVGEARTFDIVKRKSDFIAGEPQATRTAYTYYLAYNKGRDCQ